PMPVLSLSSSSWSPCLQSIGRQIAAPTEVPTLTQLRLLARVSEGYHGSVKLSPTASVDQRWLNRWNSRLISARFSAVKLARSAAVIRASICVCAFAHRCGSRAHLGHCGMLKPILPADMGCASGAAVIVRL